jgi:DnaJ-class molecular chaperone
MMETTPLEEEPVKGNEENTEVHSTVVDSISDIDLNGDYYQILGVSRDASEKHINVAYKKLALKYHPDRSENKEHAETRFRAVNDAYHTLIDPNKRRQYDLKGDKSNGQDQETVDVSTLGGIGRVFGAMISRFVPIPTQISQDILLNAQQICK